MKLETYNFSIIVELSLALFKGWGYGLEVERNSAGGPFPCFYCWGNDSLGLRLLWGSVCLGRLDEFLLDLGVSVESGVRAKTGAHQLRGLG